MDISKYLKNKINLTDENYNIQQNKNIQNDIKNVIEEENEIIIELEISVEEKLKDINILCDKDKLIKDYKNSEDLYKKININQPKIFDFFLMKIQNYI